MTPDRMTPSQYVANEIGGKAETICALLQDIVVLKARIAELEALQGPSARQQPGDNVEQAPQC